ncbi:MAG: 3-deoxy-D-manno-octulosonic acid kinase [Rhodocyclaceae bacterium]|nr:3-deoxy-D-manno-octulosonic acid kinase [Rhodocyclaceae bacterium]CAG0933302.1 Lipopolysaccharide core heptose(I) kinase RfaP [Rhodocyclaceae bacterium]
MSGWHVMPGTDPAAATRFADLDAVFALEGEIVAKDSTTRTVRVEVNGRRYYVKRYHGLGKKPLKRLLAKPRVQLEWENLRRFAEWGIPTARLVACGLEREGGRFVRGALITAEIPGTADLNRLARARDPRLKSQSWRDGVCAQVADIARRLHGRRFAHGDLKWRNLLVDAAGKVFLIDCPSGGFWWPPFLEYRIVKDLACLDKVAKRQLSRAQRLRFYLDYAQKKKLDDADKRRIRQIAGFFTGRDETQETAASLRAGGRRVLAPSTVALDDGGGELVVERWLRILPGKRLTGVGRWSGQTVLAKLFVAARGSERHWQRECRGIDSLIGHGLPTAKRLAAGRLEGAGHFVLTEYLEGARCPDASAVGELVGVFEAVGRMHARGFLQEDVHLGNFLLHADKLYVVDGDAIRPAGSERQRLDNLALLFAQLTPAACGGMQAALLAAYRRGNPDIAIDEAQLKTAIVRAREARLADLLDKCLRDCSLFKVVRRVDRFFSLVRSEADFLAPLIADPDAWIEQGIALKRGRTATLALVELNGRKLVIKRYNIKSAGHALSRAWRPSRAWHSWIEAHRLRFLGIATPRPLALIEHRLGPLRGRAWLVSEYCEGPNLQTCLAGMERLPPEIGEAARRLFAQLAGARISHGDLKASNFIWNGKECCVLDLDGVRSHDSEAAWRKAWRKDRARFLRNWPEDGALRRALDAALPPA